MKRIVAAGAVLTMTALAACSSGGSGNSAANGEPVVDGTFTMGISADPGNLNPLLSTAETVRSLTPFVYDNLLHFDPETGEPRAWLAEKWESSATSATLTLKQGITCDDGSKFTAENASNVINWAADPKNNSAMLGVLVPEDAKAEFDQASNTVTVNTQAPNSFLLTQIGSLEMVCQAALDDPASIETKTNGTGMYKLDSVLAGDSYTLSRREGYTWGPEGGNRSDTPGAPKTVVLKVVDNASTRANLLLSGQLQLAGVDGPDEDRVAAQTEAAVRQPFIVGQLYWNQLDGKPTADPAVRVALTQALDLDALNQVATSGKGRRAERLAMMNPNPCSYDAATPTLPKHDAAAAGAALDKAGWAAGADGKRSKDGKPLELTLIHSRDSEAVAASMDLVRQQLEAVGVTVKLDSSDSTAFLEKLYGEGTQAGFDVANQTVNINVPSLLTPWNSGPKPPGGRNATNIDNAGYNAEVAQARTKAGAESCPNWEAAEKALYQTADSVPFAARDNVTYAKGVRLILPNTVSAASVQLVG